MPRRVERVSELLQRELSRILLEELKDPRLRPLVTVTRVQLSEDLRYASVSVSIMGGLDEQREAMRGMESAVSFLRQKLGQRLRLRHVPLLRFTLDTSFEEGQRVLQLMDELRTKEAKGGE